MSIQSKCELKGSLKAKESLCGKLNNKIIKERPALEDLQITPSNQEQHFKSKEYGYNEIFVAGDENLTSQNIKKGVSIFGVKGNLDGIDTSGATATAEDIAKGKTAYANGEKLVGTLETDYNAKYNLFGTDFNAISNLEIINLSLIQNISRITRWSFSNASHLKEIIGLKKIDTSKVTNMGSMFSACSSLTNLDVSDFNTEKVTNMSYMFANCSSLTNLNVNNFDTEKVTDMSYMFYNCSSLANLNINNFNTEKATNMNNMFANCSLLTNLDVSNFNTENVTGMRDMFNNCRLLTNLDLSNFKTSKVTNMTQMFYSCNTLKDLNVSDFDISKVTNMLNMFANCSILSNESLNSILKMLSTVNALSSSNRTFKYLGLTQSQSNKGKTLSNWSLAEAAGWKTGY